MITLISGLPRNGKTYLLAYYGLRALRRGRRVYANFALDGADRLHTILDTLAPEFANAVFLIHESTTYFDSHEWSKLAPIAFSALAQHGKGSLDFYADALSPSFVNVRLRSITEQVIKVRRVGYDGTKIAHTDSKPWPWKRPIGFQLTWYRADNYDSDTGKSIGMAPFRRTRIPLFWRREIAQAYDTRERAVDKLLEQELAPWLESAKYRVDAGKWRVVNGICVNKPELPIDGMPELSSKSLGRGLSL